jgi:hypothetical protein
MMLFTLCRESPLLGRIPNKIYFSSASLGNAYSLTKESLISTDLACRRTIIMKNFRSLLSYGATASLVASLGLGTTIAHAENYPTLVEVQAESVTSSPIVLAGIERVAKPATGNISKAVKKTQEKLAKAEAKLARLQNELNALQQKLANGEISQATFDKKSRKLENKIAVAEQDVEVTEAKIKVAEAKEAQKEAKQALKAAEKAFKKGEISQAELEAKKVALAEAKKDLDEAKKELADTKKDDPKHSPSA